MATGGVSDMERGTDETFDFLCSICKAKNKNTEGDQFCVDCHDYYCSTCVKFHYDVPVLKNHTILNQAQFQPTSSTRLPAVPTERCKVHTHKPVDMYCKQHDTVMCSVCMVAQHSSCNEKFYIPEYIKNNSDTVNSNITDQLDMIVISLADLQDTFTKDKEKLKRSKEKSLKQIQKYRQEINQMLEELEKNTITDLEQRIQSLTDKTEAALQELQAAMNYMLTTQESLKSAGGNTAQIFVSSKMANELACRAQDKVNTTKSQYSSTEILFMPNQKLQSLLKDIQTLGDISQSEALQTTSITKYYVPQSTQTNTRGESSESQSMPTAYDSLPRVTQTHTKGESSESQSMPTAYDSLPRVTQTHTKGESSESNFIPTPLEPLPEVAQTLNTGDSCESYSKPKAHDSLPQAAQAGTSNTPYGSQTTKTQTTDKFYDSSVTISQLIVKSFLSQSRPSVLQVKGKKRYTVKVKSDIDTCYICSTCTLSDGTIILADYINSKLKRVNNTSYTFTQYFFNSSFYSLTDFCEVPKYPWQVCAITDQEVAVSCGSSELIQFVSVGQEMQKTRQINTGFQCYALAYADGRLFVSDSTSVYVYSVSGERQQQLSKNQSGHQMFSVIRSLAVSSDHSKIFVTDFEKGLIILDKTCQIVGQFNGPELKRAHGVCLYRNESVLVCGFSSKNVLQFSLDGKLLGEVLKTDKNCPAVCCNRDNSKLILGYNDDDDVEVYDI